MGEEVVAAREAQQTVINSPRPLPRTAAAAEVVREVEAKVADINSQQSLRMVVVMVVAALEEGEAVKAVLLADISSRRALMVVVVVEEEEEVVEAQLQAVLEACRQRTQVLYHRQQELSTVVMPHLGAVRYTASRLRIQERSRNRMAARCRHRRLLNRNHFRPGRCEALLGWLLRAHHQFNMGWISTLRQSRRSQSRWFTISNLRSLGPTVY